MKEKFLKVLVYLVLAGIILPVGFFAKTFSSPDSKSALTKDYTPRIITVVVSRPETLIAVNKKNSLQFDSCANFSNNSDLLQGGQAINLNQPASCFNLIASDGFAQESKLAVISQMFALPEVKVLKNSTHFNKPNLSPHMPIQPVQANPNSIAISLVMLAIIGAAVRKSGLRRSVLGVKPLLRMPFNLVLRC